MGGNLKRISFQHTWAAVKSGAKTQTRRLALGHMTHTKGDVLTVVDKLMGLKKGEKQTVLGRIRLTAEPRLEQLDTITQADVDAECVEWGRTPQEFVDGYCRRFKCNPDSQVVVLTFEVINGKS